MQTDDLLDSESVQIFTDEREAFQKIVIDNWKTFPKDKQKILRKHRGNFLASKGSHMSTEKMLSVLEEFFSFRITIEKKIILQNKSE